MRTTNEILFRIRDSMSHKTPNIKSNGSFRMTDVVIWADLVSYEIVERFSKTSVLELNVRIIGNNNDTNNVIHSMAFDDFLWNELKKRFSNKTKNMHWIGE